MSIRRPSARATGTGTIYLINEDSLLPSWVPPKSRHPFGDPNRNIHHAVSVIFLIEQNGTIGGEFAQRFPVVFGHVAVKKAIKEPASTRPSGQERREKPWSGIQRILSGSLSVRRYQNVLKVIVQGRSPLAFAVAEGDAELFFLQFKLSIGCQQRKYSQHRRIQQNCFARLMVVTILPPFNWFRWIFLGVHTASNRQL
jgi:hypothetical protein